MVIKKQSIISLISGMDTKEKIIRENGLLLEPRTIKINKGPTWGTRHSQILLYFFLVFFAYCFRTNLSVGIVAMTDPKSSNPNIPTYNWTNKGVVLSAFFWGYVLPQIPAGWLAGHFGPKWFLVGTMGTCSLAGMVIPIMAHWFGSTGVIICRAIQGLSQGFFSPSVHYLLSKWAPITERSRLSTFVYAASHIATVVSMLISGYIASSPLGWPMIFYSFSTCGLLWCIFFVFFGCNSPAEHPSIIEEEKSYIQSSLGSTNERTKAPAKTPWLKIFTSLPVWATLIAQCGYNYGYWTMLTQVPNYLNKVLKFDIESNSILCSVPYLTYWLLSLVASYAADLLINRKWLSVGGTRKLLNTIGFVVPAAGFIALANVDQSDVIALVVLLNISISSSSAAMCGFLVNHLDISPKYASTIMGLANGTSNLFSLLAPLAVQFVVTDESDVTQWKIIFYMAAGINVLTNVFFVIFASGEVQDWNDDDDCDKGMNKKRNISIVLAEKPEV